MQNKNYIWIGIVVALVLIVAGVMWLRPSAGPVGGQNATTSPAATGTTTSLGNGVSMSMTGKGTVSLVSSTPSPSLNRPITISPSLSADATAALRTNEETLNSELRQNPRRVDLWLMLGVDRKIAGDYQGAIDAWTYVAHAGPASINYIAYGDLGDIYMNFVKNYPKAEADYKAAISINPHVIDYYRTLYVFYRGQYRTTTSAAADILSQGLKANPGNPDLLLLQKQLQSGQ